MDKKKIILVIPYRGIGDLIFHIPLIRGLYAKYKSKIIVITNKVNKAKSLLANEISIKSIEYVNFERENQLRKSLFFLKKINFYNSDICILTAPTKRLIIPLLLSNSKNKIYFKKDNIKDLSKYIIKQSKLKFKDINFINNYNLELKKPKKIQKNIFISVDSRHDSNNWDQIYYIELISKILENKSINKVYINFDPSKYKNFQEICSVFKRKKKIIFVYKYKFKKLIQLMNNCLFVIGNESGPICIGAALRKRVISIYYPKHTNRSSRTIYNKVKFFNTDMVSSKKIISIILKILR